MLLLVVKVVFGDEGGTSVAAVTSAPHTKLADAPGKTMFGGLAVLCVSHIALTVSVAQPASTTGANVCTTVERLVVFLPTVPHWLHNVGAL